MKKYSDLNEIKKMFDEHPSIIAMKKIKPDTQEWEIM